MGQENTLERGDLEGRFPEWAGLESQPRDLSLHSVLGPACFSPLVLHNETKLDSSACKIHPSFLGRLHLSKQACHVEYH